MSRFWNNRDTGQRWRVTLIDPQSGDKVDIRASSDEKRDDLCRMAEEQGAQVIGVKKLYPFNLKKNYTAIRDVHDACVVALTEMQEGIRPVNADELELIKKYMADTEWFMGMPMPLAWVDGKTHKKMQEYAEKDVEADIRMIRGVTT